MDTDLKSSNRKPQRNRKTVIGILIALVPICGLCIAILALIPAFWELLFPKTIPETIQGATSHPVKFEYFQKYRGSLLYVFLPDTPPNKTDFDSLYYMSLPIYSRVIYSITNTSNKTIILNKEMPIRIISYQPYRKPTNIVSFGGGGGGSFRNFVVDMPMIATSGSIRAIFDEVPGTGQTIEDIRDEELIDFFTLSPGEVEVFSLEVRYDGPGEYIFQPGIEFIDNGNTIQLWAPESIDAILPENIIFWEPDLQFKEYIRKGKCWFAYPRDGESNFDKVYECDFIR